MAPSLAISRSAAKTATRLLSQSHPFLPLPLVSIHSSSTQSHRPIEAAENRQDSRGASPAPAPSPSPAVLPGTASRPSDWRSGRFPSPCIQHPHHATPYPQANGSSSNGLNEFASIGGRRFTSAAHPSEPRAGPPGSARPAATQGDYSAAPSSGDGEPGAAEGEGSQKQSSLADEMIAFARSCLARADSDEATHEALRVLEHGASMLRAQGGAAASQAARLLEYKAALHMRIHDCACAVEALEEVADMEEAGLCERVGALEEVVRIHLSSHADSHAMDSARRAALLLQPATPTPSPSPSPLPPSPPPLPSPGLAFLRFRVLCSVGLVEQLCGHTAAAQEHFQEADELEPPDCRAVPSTGLARLAMALHLHSTGQWEHAMSYYSQLIQCTPPPSSASSSTPSPPPSSSPSSPPPSSSSSSSPPSSSNLLQSNSPSPPPPQSPSLHPGAAVRVGALAGQGQLLLLQGDFSGAEERLTAALNEAESVDDRSDFNPVVGAVLSLLADTYAQRGRLKHTGEGLIAEGLFRRSLALLGASKWDNIDYRLSLLARAAATSAAEGVDEDQVKDQKNRVLQLDLIAFTLERYAAVLDAFPMRASEAQGMSAAAHHLWRSPLSLDAAVTSTRVSSAARRADSKPSSASLPDETFPTAVVDVTTGRVLLS